MAILVLLFRLRVAVLALLGLAMAAAGWFAFHGHAVPREALLLSATSLAVAGMVAYLHLRHAGLAALSVLAPLPGMIAAGPLAIAGGTGVTVLVGIYGAGALAAAVLSGGIVRRILDASAPSDAAREMLARSFPAFVLALFFGVAFIVGWLFHDRRALGFGGATELAAAIVSAFVFVPFLAAVLRFGEPFFVAANRARERRESLLATATLVVEPRWGFAVSGAVLVLATLAWFGVEPMLLRDALLMQPAYWGASALLAFLVAFGAGRDWRDATAATLTLAVLTLLGLYLWGRAAGHFAATAFVELAIVIATSFFVMLVLIVQSRRYRQSGDNAAVARLRAIEDAGWAPWFGMLGAIGAVLPWLLVHGSIAVLAGLFPLACAAALLGMPALSTALESLVPRRRSLDELYGRG